MRARNITQRDVANGLIVKKPCDKCGDPQSEVHHIIYPDVIRWLCKPCHRLVERQMKAKGLNAPVRDTMFGFDHIDPVEWVRMLEHGDVLESEPEKLSKAS